MQELEITGGIQPGVFCYLTQWKLEMDFNSNVAKPKHLFIDVVNASDF